MEYTDVITIPETPPGIPETPELPAADPIPCAKKPRLISYLFTVQLSLALVAATAFLFLRLGFPDEADRFLSESAALIRSDLSFAPQLSEAVTFVADQLSFSGKVYAAAAVHTARFEETAVDSLDWLLPLLGGYSVSSPFGDRVHPITGEADHHNGIDLAAERGTRIVAAASGVVTESGYDETAGNYVRIDHGGGWMTLYAHCDSLIAEKGTVLNAGDVIAYVGTTGSSTGYHLHFGIRKDGVWLDPAGLLGSLT